MEDWGKTYTYLLNRLRNGADAPSLRFASNAGRVMSPVQRIAKGRTSCRRPASVLRLCTRCTGRGRVMVQTRPPDVGRSLRPKEPECQSSVRSPYVHTRRHSENIMNVLQNSLRRQYQSAQPMVHGGTTPKRGRLAVWS